MTAHSTEPGSDKPLILAIVGIVVLYLALTAADVPLAPGGDHGDSNSLEEVLKEDRQAGETEAGAHPAKPAGQHSETSGHAKIAPPYYTVAPFVLLLAGIAVLPLIPRTEHWWEHNKNRFKLAAALAGLTLLYYVVDQGAGKAVHVAEHALLGEYIPFITLLFSLYAISGGIRIECDLKAHPIVNSAFILIGGLLASFIGTTGAAMLLIRPLLETNSERRHVQHTVIFFIFVVCNCGGCLLPIGDPPLFLGYLAGVEFFWTLNLWQPWLACNGLILVIYYVWDHFSYQKETLPDIRRDETNVRPLRISGWQLNLPLLICVVLAVAFLDPQKTIPGTDWHPWPYLREIVQISLVALSLFAGSKQIRILNHFNYHAIVEVAALFFGIFICMQPALEILGVTGPNLGIHSPHHFYWATGFLSSFLDNAPTYVVFFETASTLAPEGVPLTATGGVEAHLLAAISLGAVFMGSMTYIGNGPNFMVKAIAEKSGIRMPSFFGYMFRYSLPVLIPVFIITTLLLL